MEENQIINFSAGLQECGLVFGDKSIHLGKNNVRERHNRKKNTTIEKKDFEHLG